MNLTLQSSHIKGSVTAPASKSAMQRACAAALLKGGKTVLQNPGASNDDRAALNIIEQLGAVVEKEEDRVVITSNGHITPKSNAIDCGESGLSVRMFTPIAALADKPVTITGKGSLLSRPLSFFDEVLPALGVHCRSKGGFLPLSIQGPLKPADIEIDGSLSSQFLTGLLLAYSAANAENVTIRVKNLSSKPYVDLTLQVMRSFGLRLPENRKYEEFYFGNSIPDSQLRTPDSRFPTHHSPPDSYRVTTHQYTVEGDWSGAAFLLVAAAIAGEARVNGLMNTSRQADKKIVDALLDAGAGVEVGEDFVWVKKKNLEAFNFNATDCPDLFPPLVVLAAYCNGVTRIRGLKRLKYKESDRGKTLQEEFEKLSTVILLHEDEMIIHGNGGVLVKNQKLNSHNDHRIAMACAVAALGADFEVQIRNADAVDKSYPRFFQDLKELGGAVSLSK